MHRLLTLVRRHVIAFVALFLLLSGSAYAITGQVREGARPQFFACVAGGFHTLNLTDAASTCPSGERKISWNGAGPRGAAGPTGATGQTGPRGQAGTRGRTGAAGTPGVIGPAGVPGTAGTPGAVGAVGAQGPIGAKGDTGAAGVPGAQGAAGPRGDTGAPGTAAAQGDTGPRGDTGATGQTGDPGTDGADAVTDFAEFFALSPPDDEASVASGADVAFPQDGAQSPTGGIVRLGPDSVALPAVGVYRVAFSVPILEAGQLELTLNGAALSSTVTGRATGTTSITGEALVQTTAVDQILTVRNPAGESNALTVSTLAGGTVPSAATLIIEQLS